MANPTLQEIENLFESVLQQPSEKRYDFLAEECGHNRQLQKEVESLLKAYEEAGDFLDSRHFLIQRFQEQKEELDPYIGKRVGPYRIEKRIGYGGMGVVYFALRDDGQFRRQVAVKLIKRGLDTDFILKRFRNERQTLAHLKHPNIAKLLDGGSSEDGRPYLVMEYIEGIPIDEYCEVNNLGLNERLRLFRTVCEAVHYAHQNLIVHRDLKPGNILVTPEGTPILLDFGIAKILNTKLLESSLSFTKVEQRILTPEYASPEQTRGEAITAASDVYSLGVLLYKLLTDRLPYRFKSQQPAEMERVICEQQPDRPSTAIELTDKSGADHADTSSPNMDPSQKKKYYKHLKGDMDSIVLMALRKEPQKRYATVQQMSDDIRRHLQGLPVLARKGELWYRTQTIVKQRKVVLTSCVTAAILLFGIFQFNPFMPPSKAGKYSAYVLDSRKAVQRKMEPIRANYEIGKSHSITTTVLVQDEPVSSVPINFVVEDGPNQGITATGFTNVLGQVSMIYNSNGNIGVDRIKATIAYEDTTYVSFAEVGWYPRGTLWGPIGPPIGTVKKGTDLDEGGGITGDGRRYSVSLIEAHGSVAIERTTANQLIIKIRLQNGDPNFVYQIEIYEVSTFSAGNDLAATGKYLVSDDKGNGAAEVTMQLPHTTQYNSTIGDGVGSETLLVVLDWVESKLGGDRFSTDPMPLPPMPAGEN